MNQAIESNLIVRREPPLAYLIVNRPKARNALTAAMWTELAAAMNALSDDVDIRVVILTGAGDRSFIAGADIGELKSMLASPENEKEHYRFTIDAIHAFTRSPKPVIARIHGHCMAGGMLIELTCDLRFAA